MWIFYNPLFPCGSPKTQPDLVEVKFLSAQVVCPSTSENFNNELLSLAFGVFDNEVVANIKVQGRWHRHREGQLLLWLRTLLLRVTQRLHLQRDRIREQVAATAVESLDNCERTEVCWALHWGWGPTMETTALSSTEGRGHLLPCWLPCIKGVQILSKPLSTK